jgi:rhamnulokinase
VSGEHTNASTTQLLGVEDGKWNAWLCERAGIPVGLLPDVVPAGTALGTLRPELQTELNPPRVPEPAEGLLVVAPATHDTGSAVIGTPLNSGWAYISSGTWSLVGVERNTPLVDAATARANFTNEGGAFGTVRLLKNVMGLWLLERCRREWDEAGTGLALPDLLARAEAIEGFAGFVFPDDPRFLNPPNMADAIRTAMAETGQTPPRDPVLLAKVILDSLALRYASVLATIETLTGESVPGVHIVGGGSQNDYLNQATADAAARPVLAGPVEATALGNVLVQAIGCGEIPSLERGREILRKAVSPRRFEPRRTAAWSEAAARYRL